MIIKLMLILLVLLQCKNKLNSTHNIKPNFTMPQVKMPEEKQIIDDTKYKNYTFEFFN